MIEIWKDIDGYEGLYQVSNLGRVKSLYDGRHKIFREKILKPQKNKGYLFIGFHKNGQKKQLQIHQLVGKAFVQGWFEGAVINHKDHDPSNNIYTNLEWTTQKDNSSREKSFCAEICKKLFTNGCLSKKVLQFTLDGTFIREWPSLREIKRQLPKFHIGHICDCCNGKLKSAHKYIWKYA